MGGFLMLELFNVSLPMAFGFGFLSFFSPCILPMIPVYIMYITGVSMESEVKDNRALALKRTFAFVLGFTIIFMIMGTSASLIGQIFTRNKGIFSKISGILIIIFGLSMAGVLKFGFLNTNRQMKAPKMTNWFSSTLMGMAFAAGWSPCFGPVLASILVIAGNSDTVLKGSFLLFIYSLGMAIPFILTALFIGTFTKLMNKGEKIMKYLPKVGGVLMIIFGLLIFFDKMTYLSGLLI